MLHIVHVGNYSRDEVAGGMEILTETLSAELGRQGTQNTLLSFSLKRDDVRERGAGFTQVMLPCRRKVFEVPIPTRASRRRMREAIARADVVHLNYPSPLGTWLGRRMARRAGKPYAISVMSQIGLDEASRKRGHVYRALAWAVNRFVLRPAVGDADAIFLPSPGYLALNPHVASEEPRGIILPLGADLARFRTDLPRDHIRRKHGLEGRIVLFLGSLKATHRGKGLDVLMRAVATLRSRGGFDDVRLVVAADGELEGEFMQLATHVGIRDITIHVKGVARDEVPLYFAGADVFALPSVWPEAFGLVLAEAMACGTPVIGSRIGGIPYVIGDAGLLLPPGDVGALADALARVLSDKEEARVLGKLGRARVEAMFQWPKTAAIARAHLEAMREGRQ